MLDFRLNIGSARTSICRSFQFYILRKASCLMSKLVHRMGWRDCHLSKNRRLVQAVWALYMHCLFVGSPRQLTLALGVFIKRQWMTGFKQRVSPSFLWEGGRSEGTAQSPLAHFDRKLEWFDTLLAKIRSQDHKELQFFVKLVSCFSLGNTVVKREPFLSTGSVILRI